MPANTYIRLSYELKIANNEYLEGFYSKEELEIVLNEIIMVYQQVTLPDKDEQLHDFFRNLLTA